VPVIHQTWGAGDAVPYWARSGRPGTTSSIWRTIRPRTRTGGQPLEGQLAEQLRVLVELEAPTTQLERLGF